MIPLGLVRPLDSLFKHVRVVPRWELTAVLVNVQDRVNTTQRLADMRAAMRQLDIDAFIILSDDAHGVSYLLLLYIHS